MLHPSQNRFADIIFRNDDVSFDTDINSFKKFCEIFHRFGFIQTHGVVLWGRCNNTTTYNGEGWIFNEITPDEYHEYEKCVSVSKEYIGDNKELIEYLNESPDKIALHGLYHSDYSRMDYSQQEKDISEGLKLLHGLFPNKVIDTFIAPFNGTNDDTYRVCEKYGLKVSAFEGEHFELRVSQGKGPLYDNELYRYHHHRFYDESTFCYYDLSLDKLTDYFRKFAYTYNPNTDRALPASSMQKAVGYDEISNEGLEIAFLEAKISTYLDKDNHIIIDGYDNGLAIRLWHAGYNHITQLYKNDIESSYKQVNNLLGTNIRMINSKVSISECSKQAKGFVVFCDNVQDITKAFEHGSRLLDDVGYLFLVTSVENEAEIIDIAGKYNAMKVLSYDFIGEKEKKRVIVLRRERPKICLLCDRREWAFDYNAREIKRFLSDEFDFDIKYVVDNEKKNVDSYDAFHVFFWGENCYKKETYSKSRVIKQVASHRWQFDKPYGPIGVDEFTKKYLGDADTVICPSRILYNLLKDNVDHLFLCSEGYDPRLFSYTKERTGDMLLCSVGNLNDPVKGLKDILVPSCEGYELKMATDIKHDKLCDFYNDCDIYVVSSKHEANPLPLIESMACGCFPVSTRIGVAPEIIRHKENGYIVEERTIECFREALAWCADHLNEIREHSRERSEEMFNTRRWEILAENYRLMYRNHIWRR